MNGDDPGAAGPRIRFGEPFGPLEGYIDPDAVVAFALATNDPNPACHAGSVVSPLFTVSLLLGSFAPADAASVEPGAIVGGQGMVHAGHDVVFHSTVRPGMAVRWTSETHSVRQTSIGVLLTRRFLITSPSGAPLVEHLWGTMIRGATTSAAGGAALAEHPGPEGIELRPLARERFELARDQTYRYAGVTGDRAPHALDDEAARREGFPSKILQGTLSLAMAASAAVRWAADGDPTRLRRLAVRFSAPVLAKRELEIDLAEAGPIPGGRGRAVVFEGHQGEAVCLRRGWAEFA